MMNDDDLVEYDGSGRPSLVKLTADKILKRGDSAVGDDNSSVTISEKSEGPDDDKYINWSHLNYPKGINVFHYDVTELADKYVKIMKLVHFSTFITYATLILNLTSTIVLAASGINAINVVYSFLNIVIIVPSVCGTFYVCYLNFATREQKYSITYAIQQGVLCIVYLIFSIIAVGPINGLTRFADLNKVKDNNNKLIKDGIKIFWSIMTCVESTLFIISLIVGIFVLSKIVKFLKPKNKKKLMNK